MPVLSPMDANLSLDRSRFFDHIQWLFENGIDGVVLFGTNGEANSFSVHERMELLDWVYAQNLSNDRVIVGTGCSALTDSTTLSQHAVSLGYFNHLMLPPFYYKNPKQRGLVNYFSEIITRVNEPRLQVYLYNFPQFSGINLSAELVAELKEKYPHQITGYKDSSGNWDNTENVLKLCPDITMLPGSEVFLTRVLVAGGTGVISGTANVNPGRIKETYNSFWSDSKKTKLLQKDIDAFRLAVQKYPLIAALKTILTHYRQDEGWRNLRPPLTPLNEQELSDLLEAVKALDFTLKD